MTDSVRLYETRDGWDRLTDVVTAYVSARVEPGGNDSPRDIVLYAIAGVRQREAERLEQLEAECRGLHEQLQEARRFFLKCWDATREGYPMDGGDIQDWGVECGLLKAVTVSAPCGEGCVCDAYDGTYPTECYRPTFDASGARRVLE